MAKIYFVKAGLPPASGTGFEVPVSWLYANIQPLDPFYLGKEPPVLNEASPSRYPQYVVVELSESERDTNKFDKAGFYLLRDLSPADVRLPENVGSL